MRGLPEGDQLRLQAVDRTGAQPLPAPPWWLLLQVWLGLGLQSFGGGTATLYLIRRAVVERHRWLSDERLTRDWAVCQIAPGTNLLALTILIGWQLAGVRGIALALSGLLLPSVSITILMTALYAQVRQLEAVQDAVGGIVPATVGLGLLLAVRMARPLIGESRREGRGSLLVSALLLLGSGGLVAFTGAPIIAVLWAAGALGALFHWRRAAARARDQAPS